MPFASAATSTINIAFGAINNTGTTFNQVGSGLDSIAQSAQSISSPLASVTDSIIKMDLALAAMAATALAFAGNEAIKFEEAVIDLEKVMDKSDGGVGRFTEKLKGLSKQYAVSAVDTVNGAADFKQAGFTIEESMYLVEQSLIAVNAADMSTAASTEFLISTIRGFKAPASDAGKILDIVNKVSNKAGTNVQKLADSFKILSPLASELGISYEELASTMAPMIEVTQSGSEAANAMKTVYSNLIKPTKEVRGLLEEELGIQLEVNGERRLASKVLEDVREKTDKMTSSDRLRVAAMIAGADQVDNFTSYLSASTRSAELHTEALNADGSAQKEFTTRTKSTAFAINELKQAFKAAAISLGEEYLTETQEVVKGTTSMMEAIEQVIQGQNAEQLFDVLRGAMSDFAANLQELAKNLPAAFEQVDLTGLVRAFKDAGGEIDGIFDIDVSDPEDIARAIQYVVDTIESLTDVTTGIIKAFDDFLDDYVAGGIEWLNSLGTEGKKTFGEISGWGKIVNEIIPMFTGFTGALEGIGTALSVLAGASVVSSISSLTSLAGLGGSMASLGTSIAGVTRVLGPYAIAITGAALAGKNMGETIYRNNELIQKSTDWAVDGALQVAGMTNSRIQLRESYENMLPLIEKYIKATGDENVTIYNHMEKLQAWGRQRKAQIEYNENLERSFKELAPQIEAYTKLTGDQNVTVANHLGKLSEYRLAKEGEAQANVDLRNSYLDLYPAIKEYVEITGDQDINLGNHIEKLAEFEEQHGYNLDTMVKVRDQMKGMTEDQKLATKELIGGNLAAIEAKQAQDQMAEASSNAAKELDNVGDKAKKAKGDIQELTNDEKIRLIEIGVDLKVEQVRAQIDILKGELDSLTGFFDGTTENIGKLLDSLGKEDGYNDERLDLLDKEYDLREKIVDKQFESVEEAKKQTEQLDLNNLSMEQQKALAEKVLEKYGLQLTSVTEIADGTKKAKENQEDTKTATEKTNEELDKTGDKLDALTSEVFKLQLEVDMESIKAAAESIQMAMETTGAMFSGTGDVIKYAIGQYDSSMDLFDKWQLNDVVDKELELRERTLRQQEELNDSVIRQNDSVTELNKARAAQIGGGRPEIIIQADGLEPELKAVLNSIIEKAHVEASQGGFEYLIGG